MQIAIHKYCDTLKIKSIVKFFWKKNMNNSKIKQIYSVINKKILGRQFKLLFDIHRYELITRRGAVIYLPFKSRRYNG